MDLSAWISMRGFLCVNLVCVCFYEWSYAWIIMREFMRGFAAWIYEWIYASILCVN